MTDATPTTSEVIERFYDALANRDRPTLISLLDPEIRVTYYGQPDQLPWAGTFTGIAGFDDFLARVADNVDIVAVERRSMICGETQVAVPCLGTWRVPATGAVVEGGMVNIFSVTNNRITAYEVFADTAAFLRGLTPEESKHQR